MEPEQKSSGALIGSVVIILILIIGGIYLWKTSSQESPTNENLGTYDDSTDMEANVDNIDLEGLDSGI